MNGLKIIFVYVFIILLLVSTTVSCQLTTPPFEGEIMPESTESVAVSRNIEELGQLINLPFYPETVLWIVTPVGDPGDRTAPGPNDYKLEAVIKLSVEDMNKFRKLANSYKLNWNVEWEESYFESWYPPSVKQSFTLDTETGKYRLNGSAYDASEMFGKSPYLMGSFIITSDDEILLNLSTR